MKILMIYPKYPDTFWSFTHALKFIYKKASVPPLGLLTVSSMLPETWQRKLIDLNVSELNLKEIEWGDYVFISAMYVQKQSVDKIIQECKKLDKKIIAGGPLFTQDFNNYPQIDHLILNEAEITLPQFLNDFENKRKLKRIYKSNEYAVLENSPIPDYKLLKINRYASMSIQVSRGCPYSCDFCEITALLGQKVRIKKTEQVLNELEQLYQLNWRGSIAIVDDNFIGNKKTIKNDLLPAMKTWMEDHNYPFNFNMQSTITLADDPDLMMQLTDIGLNSAFIGIETPSEVSLHECKKKQNENRDMVQSVKSIQKAGIQVSGGFIVGFDNDLPGIFQSQIDFIQQSGIVSAMVGLLNAPKNTRLYKRMEKENRLTNEASGNNTDSSMNFIPKMNPATLLEGYNKIIRNIYSVKPYYKRIRELLLTYRKKHKRRNRFQILSIVAFLKSMIVIGILNKGQLEYWKMLLWTIIRRPVLIFEAITFSVYGYHFRTVYGLRKQ